MACGKERWQDGNTGGIAEVVDQNQELRIGNQEKIFEITHKYP